MTRPFCPPAFWVVLSQGALPFSPTLLLSSFWAKWLQHSRSLLVVVDNLIPWAILLRTSFTDSLLFQTFSVLYVHETEETYMVTQPNLTKLTKEPSATYQTRLWSQRGTRVNRPHHGDILLCSPPFVVQNRDRKNNVAMKRTFHKLHGF